MKLTDLNRQGGIGANSLFLQIGALNILIDCESQCKSFYKGCFPGPYITDKFNNFTTL